MLRFTFLMLAAVSFRPRFIISLNRNTFLPFRSAKMGHEADYPIWFQPVRWEVLMVRRRARAVSNHEASMQNSIENPISRASSFHHNRTGIVTAHFIAAWTAP